MVAALREARTEAALQSGAKASLAVYRRAAQLYEDKITLIFTDRLVEPPAGVRPRRTTGPHACQTWQC